MSRDAIISLLEKAGHTVEPFKKNSTGVVVFTTEKNRKSFLMDDIASTVGGNYSASSPIKSSSGCVKVGNTVIVAKPAAGKNTGNISTLDARAFTSKGKSVKFKYGEEEIDCMSFTSAATLASSIIEGCRKSSVLGDNVADVVEGLFNNNEIVWDPSINEAVKNKLGVYLGEVLIGVVLLANRSADFCESMPIKGRMTEFLLPTDPSFSGVDSFILDSNKNVYALSSKFDRGAKASIFTNLIPKGLQYFNKLGKSEFKTLLHTIISNNLKPTDSKKIMYEYGVRNLLGISPKEIPDPTAVFDQIKSGKIGKEAALAIYKVEKTNKMQKIAQAMPNAVSSYFNMTLAEKINNDKASVDQIKEILSGKDYWQLNLNKRDWMNGKLMFKFTRSGEAVVKIDGAKSPAGDVTCKQGWVNYELS
jgi:hypothetical protein